MGGSPEIPLPACSTRRRGEPPARPAVLLLLPDAWKTSARWGGGRVRVLLPAGVGRERSRGWGGPEGGRPCCESPTAANHVGPAVAGG
jgi:hypothetical protein